MSAMYEQPHTYNRTRRTSFSAGQTFAPYNDPFRPGRDGFNDPYNNGYSEQFPPAGGYGSYPPPGAMGTSYSMGNREQPPSPPEPSGFDPTGVPPRAAYPDSYDNSPLSDSYFPAQLDDGFGARGRAFSTSGGGGFGPPALLPSAPPMTPYPSHHSVKRMRRASSVGPGYGHMGHIADPYRSSGGIVVKFRLSGGHRDGISLNEATNSVRLGRSTNYSIRDLAPDHRGRITLKVRWTGYHSLVYEIPVSSEYDGFINLQSLARRVARAIVHFMTKNAIALHWDRVVVHRLEEIQPGVWIPVLSTH
ncbi:hypothetical protein BJV78DRAFT_1197037 [Lactifluus subvellereus]|nr:hypothetical protein BJV78DRAFT_1197037 [Lactifluus subvellereus]